MSVARWRLLSKTPWIARSSHCMCAVHPGVLVVYGGELEPRVPVDSAAVPDDGPVKGSVHVLVLRPQSENTSADHGREWRTITPATGSAPQSAPAVPEARVGASIATENGYLYLWGGRGGVDMSPLDSSQTGIWEGTFTHPDFADGETQGIVWNQLMPDASFAGPEPRSYHTSLARQGQIYVHAGCPASGRLGSFHKFDMATRQWRDLVSAPDPPRGGTVIATMSLLSWGPAILRFGGYNGYELPSVPGTLDLYSLAENRWYTVQPSPDPVHGYPGRRSVHGFVRFQSTKQSCRNVVAVLFHGERDASSLGHAGAGVFWDDVWLLTKSKDDHVLRWGWKKLLVRAENPEIIPDHEGKAGVPEGRGWFAFTEWVEDGTTRIFMHGGLIASNQRSDELWELQID